MCGLVLAACSQAAPAVREVEGDSGPDAGIELDADNLFVLNGLGDNHRHNIFISDRSGNLVGDGPAIGPDAGFRPDTNVYWPSAVRAGAEIMVYATVQDAAGLRTLHLWRSAGTGEPFEYSGLVLQAEGDKGQIGMSHVAHDPEDADAPFKLWYSTRYVDRGTAIYFATSADGVSWNRIGPAYEAHLQEEAAGLTVDFVCKEKSGEWRLFYSAVESVDKIRAMEANSASASGPYISPRIVLEPDAVAYDGAASVSAEDRSLKLSGEALPRPGFSYVLTDGTQENSRLVFVERVLDSTAQLKSPAGIDAEHFRLLSTHARKVSPSFFCRSPEGGRGLFTGFGAIPGITIEYVFSVEERDGRFFPIANDEVFRPEVDTNQFSFENPVPISGTAYCPPC